MIRLAIDTALAACSTALFEDDRLIASADEVIGRGHAERLLPMVAEVMRQAGVDRADDVLVDVGPGSFAGIRVGVAAARAFGLAWGAEVRGYTATALVAAASDAGRLLVALEAGRGELYCQPFDDAVAVGEIVALAPGAAIRLAEGRTLAGSGAAALMALDAQLLIAGPVWPRAADVLRLARGDRVLAPRPLYVRAPDAKLPA